MGMAIRQNVRNLYGMKKSIGAYCTIISENKDLEVRHQFRPKLETSWCKYQFDKVTGKKTYKDKFTIPHVISRDFSGGQNQPTTQCEDVLLPHLEFVFPHIFLSG